MYGILISCMLYVGTYCFSNNIIINVLWSAFYKRSNDERFIARDSRRIEQVLVPILVYTEVNRDINCKSRVAQRNDFVII